MFELSVCPDSQHPCARISPNLLKHSARVLLVVAPMFQVALHSLAQAPNPSPSTPPPPSLATEMPQRPQEDGGFELVESGSEGDFDDDCVWPA